MKTLISIGSLFRDGIGDKLFSQLCAIYPEGNCKDHTFDCCLVQEDPRVMALLAMLTKHGYEPRWFQPSVQDKSFMMEVLRVYDVADYEQSSYLVPLPEADLFESERAEDGLLELIDIKTHESIAAATDCTLIVSDSLKQEMEQAGLEHLVFVPTRMTGQRGDPSGESYWELISDLTLPALSPSMYLANLNGEPFNGNYREGFLLREASSGLKSLIVVAELHYVADDLKAVEPFDLAHTREKRSMVASQRFYRFCVERQLKIVWHPVRIDAV